MFKNLIAALLLAFAIVGCSGEKGETSKLTMHQKHPMMNKTFDRSGEIMMVQVITYDSYEAIRTARIQHESKFTGRQISPPHLYGWAVWSKDSEGKINQCQLHVMKLNRVDEPETATWGHELAHCIYGSYHRESD